MGALQQWLGFIACAGAILYSGSRLSGYGDIIAEKTGLGRTWIGVALLATVTSLPELANGISSVTLADAPDLAVGDALGSCAFNLLILAAIDAMHREPLSARVSRGHILSAAFGILLLSITAAGLVAGQRLPDIFGIGLPSLVILGAYAIGIRSVFTYERREFLEFAREQAAEPLYAGATLRDAALGYARHALVVVAAAVMLPVFAKAIAEATGLGQTFIGSLLVALTTSLPEVVVSITAVRMNAPDLAVATLLGSNTFDILIIAIDDVFYLKGPLLGAVGPLHLYTALAAMAMTAVCASGIAYRSGRKRYILAWDSAVMSAIFICLAAGLYFLG